MNGTQVASLYADIGADLSGFKKGMGQFDDMLHKAGGGLSSFTGMITKGLLGATAAGVGGLAALTAGIVSVTGDAADMQQAVANIAANMTLTGEETAKVADLVNDLGIDPKLKVTATESAEAIDMLGKNGLNLQQIMDGAARSTVLLANSTGGDFGKAADIATDVMAQFGIEAKDMMTAVNQITGVTQKSKFDIDSYGLAVAQAGGVAASVGVSFEDFNATIAAISPLFASGSDAGTSYKTFLQRLVPSTKPATKAMKELGIITADGANQFFDASGQMKGMAEIAGILNKAFVGLTEEQKINYASTIFGTDAMRAAFAIADGGAESINKLKGEIGKTDAEQAAATRMNTLSGVMEIFWGVIDSLKIQIGQGFLPVAQRLTEKLTDLATNYGPQVVEWAKQFSEQIEVLFNYIMAAVEDGDTMNDWLTHMHPLLKDAVLGTIDFINAVKEFLPVVKDAIGTAAGFIESIGGITTVLKIVGGIMAGSAVLSILSWVGTIVSAIGTIGSFIGGITGIGGALSAVLAFFNPVGLAIAAVGVAAGGLYLAWKNNFLGIQDITYGVMEKVKGWFAGLQPSIDALKNQFYEWGKVALNKVSEGFNAAKTAVQAELQRVMSDVKEHGASYAAGAFAGRMYDAARETALNFGRGLLAAAPTLRNDVAGALNAVTAEFNNVVSWLHTYVWDTMKNIGSRVASGMADGIRSGISDISSALSYIQSLFTGSSIPVGPPGSIGGHASGGMMTAGGRTWVGERGPEIVDLPAGSYVHNNAESMSMMGGSSSRIDVYIHANGTMPTDRAAIRQLAIELQREMGMNGGRVVFG